MADEVHPVEAAASTKPLVREASWHPSPRSESLLLPMVFGSANLTVVVMANFGLLVASMAFTVYLSSPIGVAICLLEAAMMLAMVAEYRVCASFRTTGPNTRATME